jgi:hypothetical protein
MATGSVSRLCSLDLGLRHLILWVSQLFFVKSIVAVFTLVVQMPLFTHFGFVILNLLVVVSINLKQTPVHIIVPIEAKQSSNHLESKPEPKVWFRNFFSLATTVD